MPTDSVCPKCGSGSFARAHRKKRFERVVSEIGLFPFRCGRCGHRFSSFDLDALHMEHVERKAWLTSTRVFWVSVVSLLILFLAFYYRGGL